MKILTAVVLSVSLVLPYSVVFPVTTHAISDALVISHLQTAGSGPGSSTQELIVVYNGSSDDVRITNWCTEYSSASDNKGFDLCFEPPEPTIELWLEAKGFLSISTQNFIDTNPLFVSDFIMKGGMAAGSGHLRLFDQAGAEQDRVGWGDAIHPEGVSATAHRSGEVLSRELTGAVIDSDDNSADFSMLIASLNITSGVYEKKGIADSCLNIEGVQPTIPIGFLQDSSGDCFEDFCPNIDGLQIVAPEGYEKPEGNDRCIAIPAEDATIFITELFPNAPSIDTGNEYIELYNPNEHSVKLRNYRLEVGPSYIKKYIFTDQELPALSYMLFSDVATGIVLPNSNGVQLRLISAADEIVSTSDVYSNAADDETWALVEDNWIWTNQMTPSSANKPYLQSVVDEVVGITTVYAPCPEGKFRNPETNRCKNIGSAVSLLTPCGEDEFRSLETNRCRKTATATSSLTPCNPGQTRNPETNRCRSTTTSTSSLKACDEGEQRNPETNRCRKTATLGISEENLPIVNDIAVESTAGQVNWLIITLSTMVLGGYMIYEWRVELANKYKLARIKIATR